MVDYRDNRGAEYRRSSGVGRTLAILLVAIAAIVGVLFATGFWKADMKGGELPRVQVSAQGGDMPEVELKSKEVVVGTAKTTVDVPTVGVKDDND